MGECVSFETGAVRSDDTERPDFTNLCWDSLGRVCMHLQQHYTDRGGKDNWKQGVPYDRALRGMLRHAAAVASDTRDGEDHLAAIVFNVMCMMRAEAGATEATVASLAGPCPCGDKPIADCDGSCEYARGAGDD